MRNNRIAGTVFLLILAAFPFALQGADWSEIIRNEGPSIGRVIIEDGRGVLISQGSGFVTADTRGGRIFVTNAHVVRDAWFDKSMTVTLSFDFNENLPEKDRRVTGAIERIDTYMDLAILSFGEKEKPALSLNRSDSAELMSDIVVAGYPLGKSFKATPGMIQAFQDIESVGRMIDMSATLAPGNSGGPVLDGKGEVIGIATSIIRGYNFNLAIPVGNLIRFIDGENSTVEIRVETAPPGTRVFINGDYKGETPLNISLFNNQYSLTLEKEGYSGREETIGPWENLSGNTISRSMEIVEITNPLITIITDPPGADIYVGNVKAGVSPYTLEVPAGRILRIRAKKGFNREGSVNYRVTEDKEQTVRLELN